MLSTPNLQFSEEKIMDEPMPQYEMDYDDVDDMWNVCAFDSFGPVVVASCEHLTDAELICRLLNEDGQFQKEDYNVG